ncbi:MAG TPA: DUF1801 domain-containing protein [Candidatus Acidoferrales bacterium]|nr:DUF1801 domain-containing protein [Candidatus Acidoferrales bacterium]
MSRKSPKSVDDYVARYPRSVQRLLRQLRLAIRNAAPGANEIISYGIPSFALNGILVWFAAFRNHIGFYPRAAAVAAFRKELSRYKTAKGSVQFPLDKPLPLALVRRIVKFRVKENLAKRKKN